MRTVSLVLVLVVAGLLCVAITAAIADTGSISRHELGMNTYDKADPLGGPPTPKVYGFGQSTIFAVGIVLLVMAAALAAYTLVVVRRHVERR